MEGKAGSSYIWGQAELHSKALSQTTPNILQQQHIHFSLEDRDKKKVFLVRVSFAILKYNVQNELVKERVYWSLQFHITVYHEGKLGKKFMARTWRQDKTPEVLGRGLISQ